MHNIQCSRINSVTSQNLYQLQLQWQLHQVTLNTSPVFELNTITINSISFVPICYSIVRHQAELLCRDTLNTLKQKIKVDKTTETGPEEGPNNNKMPLNIHPNQVKHMARFGMCHWMFLRFRAAEAKLVLFYYCRNWSWIRILKEQNTVHKSG